MELNVSNIPINTIYRFDTNKYVWTTMLMETRGGMHSQGEPFKITEVYEFTNEGYIKLVASGKLTIEPGKSDYSREFGIFDYDKGTTTNFRVPMYLQELKLEDLYELRDAITRNYKKSMNNSN